MSNIQIVEWTEKSWYLVKGCDKAPSVCANCYTKEVPEGYLKRWKNPGFSNGFNLTLQEDQLELPMKWKMTKQVKSLVVNYNKCDR